MSYLYRMKYQKNGPLRFISHLDLNQLFRRVLLRADIPVELTEGYNPRIKVSFGPALPLGIEGWQEITEIVLKEPLAEEELKGKINKVAPSGFKILEVEEVSNKRIPLSKLLRQASYLFYLIPVDAIDANKMVYYHNKIEQYVKCLLDRKDIKIKKESKKGLKEVDLRPYISKIDIFSKNNDRIIICLILNIESGVCINPNPIIHMLVDVVKDYFFIGKIIREKFISESLI
jgi:radical SAM-linked protein